MKTETVPIESLSVHPLLAHVPEPDSELITAIARDLEDRGIIVPFIVDEKNRVMDIDGRDRLNAATQIELLGEVPVLRAAGADAATILVQSLLQRRHYSKSALAYVTFPFFAPMLDELRARRLRYFKSKKEADASISPAAGLMTKSAEQLAIQVGVSRSLFFNAKQVHELLQKHPLLKEATELRICNGDLDLDGAIHSITGSTSTKGTQRQDATQLELFENAFHVTSVRFATRWTKLSSRERDRVVAQYVTEFLPSLPPELHRAYQRFLRSNKSEARAQ
jgi:hypothetical protein